MNADLNAAFNHIKVGFKEHAQQITDNMLSHKGYLAKFCNPVKLKSNHEFDKLLTQLNKVDNHQIVDIRKGRNTCIKYYLSHVAIKN